MTDVAHAPRATTQRRRRRTGIAPLTAPGWLRVLWVTPIFFGIGFGLAGLHPLARRLGPDLEGLGDPDASSS